MTRQALPTLSSSVRLLPFLGLLFSPLVAGSRPLEAQEPKVLTGMAALVNNEVITYGQVRELVEAREENARRTLKGNELIETIKKIRLEALNELIDRQLILQEFKTGEKKSGWQIPKHVVEDHVSTIIREQFGNDRQAFIRTLAAQGFTLERFEEMERDKIIVQAMRGQQIKPTAIVAEPRIREFYEKNRETYTSEEQMHLLMLVLRKSSDGTSRRKMMEELRGKITDGTPFADLARVYDEGSSDQENRGDWGWIGRKTLNETLTKEAFKLKPGQVSQIIEIDGSYYLLYCDAHKGEVSKPLKEVRDEIEKKLIQEDRQKQMQAWLGKLRSKAFVKIY